MKKIKTQLEDCYLIEPDKYGDERGYFTEFYNARSFEELGLDSIFKGAVQGNRSFSKKGTLRGMHYQLGESAQAKLVECLKGAVLDVVVDLRKSSKTYKKWISVVLAEESEQKLLVPKGFAHGFLTLKDDTLFQYLVDSFYDPKSEDGFAYDDEEIGIIWPLEEYGIEKPILSDKDKNRKKFSQSECDF